jgi:hypothetical protein
VKEGDVGVTYISNGGGGRRGTPEGKKLLGSQRHTWVDLGERGWDSVDWIGLAQDRDMWRALVNVVMNLQVL